MANVGLTKHILDALEKTRSVKAGLSADDFYTLLQKYCEKHELVSLLFELSASGQIVESKTGGVRYFKLPETDKTPAPVLKTHGIPKFLTSTPKETRAPTTKVYTALKFIEEYPNCNSSDVAVATEIGRKNVKSTLMTYINSGDVVINENVRPLTFSLARSVDAFYPPKGQVQKISAMQFDQPVSVTTGQVDTSRGQLIDVKTGRDIETGEQMMFGGITNEDGSTQTEQVTALDQPANALLEWDASRDQNQVESSAQNDTQETVNEDDYKDAVARHNPEKFFKAVAAIQKVNAGFDRALNIEAPQPATSGNFRVAYTNDGCLMLMGLNDYGLPIELNAAQTNDLIEFISDQIMPIGVSM